MLCHWLPLSALTAAIAVSIPHPVDASPLEIRASNASTTGNTKPIAAKCGPNTANIICVDNSAVFPPSFSRDPNPAVGYAGTKVPDDASFQLLAKADFMVFDRKRGLELLGPSPKVEKVFDVLNVIHEAPVYVPQQNKLYFAQAGPPGNLSALVVDLNVNPPTLSTYDTTPKTYQPNGAAFHDGKIYWSVMGNNVSLPDGLKQRPGIARLDPASGKVETLLNNYYGFSFSGPNDIAVDRNGDIWFTDSDYSYGLSLSDTPPQIQLATYRFRPSTGAVTIVEDSLNHPNGIAFSPDGRTLYITDSGLESVGTTATKGAGDFYNYPIKIDFTSTAKRNIYAYDVVTPGGHDAGPYLINKRVVYQSVEGAPDGLKVAKNGYLVAASGLSQGVDILTPGGALVARIQATHPVENVAWSGKDLKTLWLVGIGGVTRVEFALAGQAVV